MGTHRMILFYSEIISNPGLVVGVHRFSGWSRICSHRNSVPYYLTLGPKTNDGKRLGNGGKDGKVAPDLVVKDHLS